MLDHFIGFSIQLMMEIIVMVLLLNHVSLMKKKFMFHVQINAMTGRTIWFQYVILVIGFQIKLQEKMMKTATEFIEKFEAEV